MIHAYILIIIIMSICHVILFELLFINYNIHMSYHHIIDMSCDVHGATYVVNFSHSSENVLLVAVGIANILYVTN